MSDNSEQRLRARAKSILLNHFCERTQAKFIPPLVDMTGDLQPEGKVLYLAADPVHLNARGNQLIAERLFETIERLIHR